MRPRQNSRDLGRSRAGFPVFARVSRSSAGVQHPPRPVQTRPAPGRPRHFLDVSGPPAPYITTNKSPGFPDFATSTKNGTITPPTKSEKERRAHPRSTPNHPCPQDGKCVTPLKDRKIPEKVVKNTDFHAPHPPRYTSTTSTSTSVVYYK